MIAPPIEHNHRIIRRQAGPLGYVHAFLCSCGCASPESTDRSVAVIARRSHLVDIGKAGEE